MSDEWRRLVLDLDRCEHGRHEGDPCSGESGCNGPSKGNPLIAAESYLAEQRLEDRFGFGKVPPRLIGFGLDGVPICIPERVMGRAPEPEDYYRG